MSKKFEKKSDKLKIELVEYTADGNQCNSIVKLGQGIKIKKILEAIQNHCKEERKEKEYSFYLMETKNTNQNGRRIYDYEKWCFILKY